MTARKWSGRCHRCGKRGDQYTMSRFNTDLICMECDAAERQHPAYADAAAAEEAAVLRGDYNFPGVGWPGDGRTK